MTADFTAAAVLITYGALLGKVSRLQLLVIAILECIFFAINEAVIVEYLHISDVGGSIVVHLFGAYFGLTISAIIRNYGDENGKEGSVYHSDLFSMIGRWKPDVYNPPCLTPSEKTMIAFYLIIRSSIKAKSFLPIFYL